MAIIQRPVKGSRISSFYPVHELPSLASLDSAFQLQEYISLLIRLNVHDVDAIVSLPGKSGSHERDSSDGGAGKDSADKEGKSEVTVDEACWIYEQLRRLAQDLSHPLITTMQQECTRQTCPEMKAGEWLYLCVAHGNEGAMEQCCAIDYILHTLDSATALLNSPRAFPSRLSIPPASTRHFSSLARRLGRIFAHAYYHHREAFEQAEAESSLYARFLALTSKFALVPLEFLVIPPRMNIQVHARDDDRDESLQSSEEPEESPIDLDTSEYMNTARRIHGQERLWLDPSADSRNRSPPGPAGDARNPSPRKGRSRTDTMVYSEAVNVAEELAKGHGLQEAELDREIAQERLNAYELSDVGLQHPASQPLSSQKSNFEDSASSTHAPQAPEMSLPELSAEDAPAAEPPSGPAPVPDSTPQEPQEVAEKEEKEETPETTETAKEEETTEVAESESEENITKEESHFESVQEVDVTDSVEQEPLVEAAPTSESETEAEVVGDDNSNDAHGNVEDVDAPNSEETAQKETTETDSLEELSNPADHTEVDSTSTSDAPAAVDEAND